MRTDRRPGVTKLLLFAILETRLKTAMALAVFELWGRPASSVVAVPTAVCYGGNWLSEISSLQTAVEGCVGSQSVSWALDCHSMESVTLSRTALLTSCL
jgi:hypothetical protein